MAISNIVLPCMDCGHRGICKLEERMRNLAAQIPFGQLPHIEEASLELKCKRHFHENNLWAGTRQILVGDDKVAPFDSVRIVPYKAKVN